MRSFFLLLISLVNRNHHAVIHLIVEVKFILTVDLADFVSKLNYARLLNSKIVAKIALEVIICYCRIKWCQYIRFFGHIIRLLTIVKLILTTFLLLAFLFRFCKTTIRKLNLSEQSLWLVPSENRIRHRLYLFQLRIAKYRHLFGTIT